jgi:hypothetical protein
MNRLPCPAWEHQGKFRIGTFGFPTAQLGKQIGSCINSPAGLFAFHIVPLPVIEAPAYLGLMALPVDIRPLQPN